MGKPEVGDEAKVTTEGTVTWVSGSAFEITNSHGTSRTFSTIDNYEIVKKRVTATVGAEIAGVDACRLPTGSILTLTSDFNWRGEVYYVNNNGVPTNVKTGLFRDSSRGRDRYKVLYIAGEQ